MSRFLKEQILTYIGNKRSLLPHIAAELDRVRETVGRDNLVTLDLFSGSGVVARLLKQYSKCVYANDLELYSGIINSCYLSNASTFDEVTYYSYLAELTDCIQARPVHGIVSRLYSPANDKHIASGDRAFYTNENALFIDSMRFWIDEIVPQKYKKFFLARLLVEASIHVNTSGVFKGFYKDKATGIGKFGGSGENALSRITGAFDMSAPVLSERESYFAVYRKDANELAAYLKNLDVAYLDPPYNQHPYGSNYFMLNVIARNSIDAPISKVSGIPSDWNRSAYNNRKKALSSLEGVVSALDSLFVIVSYNNEGFISKEEMEAMLRKYGTLETKAVEYNAFRGSRNLSGREQKTTEYLFILHKK